MSFPQLRHGFCCVFPVIRWICRPFHRCTPSRLEPQNILQTPVEDAFVEEYRLPSCSSPDMRAIEIAFAQQDSHCWQDFDHGFRQDGHHHQVQYGPSCRAPWNALTRITSMAIPDTPRFHMPTTTRVTIMRCPYLIVIYVLCSAYSQLGVAHDHNRPSQTPATWLGTLLGTEMSHTSPHRRRARPPGSKASHRRCPAAALPTPRRRARRRVRGRRGPVAGAAAMPYGRSGGIRGTGAELGLGGALRHEPTQPMTYRLTSRTAEGRGSHLRMPLRPSQDEKGSA